MLAHTSHRNQDQEPVAIDLRISLLQATHWARAWLTLCWVRLVSRPEFQMSTYWDTCDMSALYLRACNIAYHMLQ